MMMNLMMELFLCITKKVLKIGEGWPYIVCSAWFFKLIKPFFQSCFLHLFWSLIKEFFGLGSICRNVPSSAALPIIRPALGGQQSISERAKLSMQGYLNHFLGNLDIVNSREVKFQHSLVLFPLHSANNWCPFGVVGWYYNESHIQLQFFFMGFCCSFVWRITAICTCLRIEVTFRPF